MILVTGAGGFVGNKIMQTCREAVACPSLRGMSEEAVRRLIADIDADAIVHTAAIADIGVCQTHPEDSYLANVLLPVWLAKAATGKKLICFSSDQVYGGMTEDGPYTEDAAGPHNVYAAHKLEMEQRVLDIAPDAVMLRAEWMYDYVAQKPNYFLNVVNAHAPLRFSSRQYRGVTYVKEVADNLPAVLRLPGGVYNFGSETTQSMADITKAFLRWLGKDIPLEEAPAAPSLWMNCAKATRHGVIFRTVEDGLRQCAADSGRHR